MANKPLKSIKFPSLNDTYTIPQNAGDLAYDPSTSYGNGTIGKELNTIDNIGLSVVSGKLCITFSE